MAEAIVGPLLSKLQDVVVTEAKALAAVGGEVEKLSDKLMWLQALVHETDLRSRHDGDRLVRVLTCQIRTVAFEAEDAVDEFYLKGDLFRRFGLAQRFGRNWGRAAVELLVNFRTHFFVRVSLSSRVQSMNARLEDIVNNSSKYGMRQGGSSSADGMTWRASRAIPLMRDDWENSEPFKLIGRKKEKEDLKHKLMHDTSGPVKVIRVVGPAGIGKRALLKDAYEDETIREHFLVVVFMSFPPGISADSSTVKKNMEESLDKECAWRNIPRRQDARCLVLIDGTSIGPTTWSKVEPELQQMVGQGSKILMTQASWHEQKNDGIIELKHLLRDESKTLFNHVLGLHGKRKSAYATLTMNEIRDNIEVITHGLPLAVVLLAKFMSTVPYSKWRAASEYIKSNCEDDLVKTILSVCIDDLPDELKSCLLYTAGLPQKRHIDARELVRLWMAEGFLTQKQGLETEQLGQSYLKELVYRGLLKLIRKTSTADGGRVESVVLPEQIHPLIRLEAQRTSFMDIHYGGSVPPPANTRRLALLNMHNDKKFSAPSSFLDKLRTVVSYSDHDGYMDHKKGWKAADADDENKPRRNENEPIIMAKLLRGSPFLRVIHLEEGLNQETQLPDEIGEMVHLQYLGVRCRSLKRVPSSIGNLGRLQTVDVRGTQVKDLPKSLWKIRTLRHVLGDGLIFPRSTRDLKLMQTLETVTIQHVHVCSTNIICKRRKNKFGLRFLHRLGVIDLGKNQGKDLETILKELSYLESLSLSGELIPIDLFADAASCLDNVASMELDGKLPPRNDPCCDESLMRVARRCLLNLTRLVLRRTNINQAFLNVIGMLPILAELEMHEESYDGVQMDLCSQRFNSLLVLRITSLVILKRVTFPAKMAIKPIFYDMEKIDCEAHVSCSFCNASTGGPAHVEHYPLPAAPNATGGLADAGQHPQPAAPNSNGILADVRHHPPPVAPYATRGLADVWQHPPQATGSQADMGQQQHPPPSSGNNEASNGGDGGAQLGNEQSDTGGDTTGEATAPSPVQNYPEMIVDAIKALDQRGDKTNKTEIKKYIKDEGNYSNLPQGNELRKVINGHLGTMVDSRVLILSRRMNCYVIADAHH